LEPAEINDVIGRQQVVDLPVKSRQFLDLAMLSPGVVRPPGGTRGDAMQQAGNLVNVLGQRSGHNLYLMDGVAITDEYFNNMVIAPSIDAIEECNIEKTSYAPEFGGKSGAVINVVSRSGSMISTAACSNSFATTCSMPKTSLTRTRRRFLRFVKTSSGEVWADRSTKQNVFLPELRRSANSQVLNPNVLGSDGRNAKG
jgi:hypothetical protein